MCETQWTRRNEAPFCVVVSRFSVPTAATTLFLEIYSVNEGVALATSPFEFTWSFTARPPRCTPLLSQPLALPPTANLSASDNASFRASFHVRPSKNMKRRNSPEFYRLGKDRKKHGALMLCAGGPISAIIMGG